MKTSSQELLSVSFRWLPLALALLAGPSIAAAQQEEAASDPAAPAALEMIRQVDLEEYAAWLASDERGGRLTGSPGQEAAAEYIRSHFDSIGLEPLGDLTDDGTHGWLQHYGIERTYIDPETVLEFAGQSVREGFAVMGGSAVDLDLQGKLMFCGMGRTRGPSSDLAEEADLTGRVPVVLLRGPRGRLDRKLSVEEKFGVSMSALGGLGRTARGLERRGAKAVVFLLVEDPMGISDVLNYLALSPGKDQVAARFKGAEPGMSAMGRMFTAGAEAPLLVAGPELSGRMLESLEVDRDAVLEWLQGEGEPVRSDKAPDARLRLLVARDAEATACNVVGVLRGSDPELSKTAIVYSAHMDHVGRRADGEIFNGADDNASGSAGLMAIATAFAKAEERPKRSVIFLSVSGEELGLWGSQYYADNPTWPLEGIVANINTDMIGRSGPESGSTEVTVTPSNRHRMFSTIVQDAAGFAERLGMTFTNGDKYYQRSDHYNFAKNGIPAVFFCNGEHEDYHQVTDHADKLDGAKMERIARLAFWTGWAVANQPEAPRTLGPRQEWR